MIGTVTRRIGTPAARNAVSSLNRLSRNSVNAAATTGMMPLICVKMRKQLVEVVVGHVRR